jgi:hypothetical protein
VRVAVFQVQVRFNKNLKALASMHTAYAAHICLLDQRRRRCSRRRQQCDLHAAVSAVTTFGTYEAMQRAVVQVPAVSTLVRVLAAVPVHNSKYAHLIHELNSLHCIVLHSSPSSHFQHRPATGQRVDYTLHCIALHCTPLQRPEFASKVQIC